MIQLQEVLKIRQVTICTAILLLTIHGRGQNNGCFEVKYFDFFGISELGTLKWRTGELDTLLEFDFSEDEISKRTKTNFLIPLIVHQLKNFYPLCPILSDTTYYFKLIQLYFNIRQQNISVINGMRVAQQLEFIRQDYYDQVLNDSLLPYMEFTLDDGPIYGRLSDSLLNFNSGKIFEIDFGKLFIVDSNERIFLGAADRQMNVKWTRIMTSAFGEYLKDLEFSLDPVYKTSRAYIVSMYSQQERLTLYINLEGEFMYYFHSW